MEFVSTGTSSIEIGRTSKGEHTYNIKLYFVGSTQPVIDKVVENIAKTRRRLEAVLGIALIPDAEQSAFERRLLAIAAGGMSDGPEREKAAKAKDKEK